ncbi:MAG: hypothetical protein LUH05_02870, partial [Candidatus Gastranaerophilales bacterium]|nr:hypothetical protein [Candidatus Gastranaerophilales bacterium]
MSILKNDDNIMPKENMKSNMQTYEIPAVIRKEKEEISFEKALAWAVILHPAIVLILLVSSLILKFLGIDFSIFNKPDLKPKDIEFVLVEKEAPPIDKNTKNRADKNSQAGGKHDPKRPVSLPQQSAPKSEAKKPSSPAPSKPAAQKPQTKPQTKPQAPKQTAAQPKQQQAAEQQVQKTAPKPAAPKPTVVPSVPKPTVNPSSNFNIPIPKSSIPQIAQPTAPVTSAPKTGTSGSSSGGSGSSAPSPSFSPTTSSKSGAGGTGTGAGGGGRFSNGTGTGTGNVGNPGPGNPKGAPGIDAIKEPDFGPYMKELQRRIKMNWDPPKGNESKRVILLF